MSHRHSLFLLSLLLIMGLAAPAVAETRAEAAKPETKTTPHEHKHARTAEPKIVTTAFGVWALRCRTSNEKAEKDKGASKPARACEISETLEAPDHSGPIAKLSVGRPGGKGDLTAIVILPNNVSFPSSVNIRSDDKDIWGVRLDWIRCIPGGCFAQATLAPATIAHWHGLDTKGSIVFRDATGDNVSLPMSFQGFGAAIDALNKAQ